MPDEPKPNIDPETPVIKILTQIRNEEINPKDLPKEIRQECVEYLWITEAQPVAIIANVLDVSEKTIRRVQEDIRSKNATKPSRDQGLKMIGEFIQKATALHEHMMKLSHDKNATVQETSQAGYYMWKILQGQLKEMERFGYVSTAFTNTEGSQSGQEEKSIPELKARLAEMERILSEDGVHDPQLAQLIKEVKHHIAIAEATKGLNELETRIHQIKNPPENPNEQG